MPGAPGKPVDDESAVTPELEGASMSGPKMERRPTAAPEVKRASTGTPQQYVRGSQSLSAGEQEFVLKRKQTVLESLSRLGINSTSDSVPHIALLGSGGGQRAAVALIGSLYQMKEEGLLDSVLYLGGVSGSAWSMASLYSDPRWSADLDGAVFRLSGPGVGLDEALAWLGERAEEEHFSLTDIWGLITAAGIMNQVDLRHLSEDLDRNGINPYPIYSAIDHNCQQSGPMEGKWFEVTPHEAGFTDLGLFVNISRLGSRFGEAETEDGGLQMDMVKLQAQVHSFWDVLDLYMRGSHTLDKLVDLVRNNMADPTALSELDDLQKTLRENLNLNPFASFGKKSPEERRKILERWSQEMLKPIETWSQSLEEGPYKDYASWLIKDVFPLIGRWEWGTTENFLYQYPDAAVPSCLRSKEQIQLIDAGVMINLPFPPLLGHKRDVDLIIALEYSAGNMFETLTLTRDYAAKVNKTFPEIDDEILEDKDWPKDCYVLQGEQNQPTIVYMPLFNRNNSKDAEEVKQKMEEFSTFQLPFSQEKIQFLLETAKANMKNNKETILREIKKAAGRRQSHQDNDEERIHCRALLRLADARPGCTIPAGAPGTPRTCWSTHRTCWSTGHPPYLLEHPPYLLEHRAPPVPAGAPTVPAGAPGTLRTCWSTLRTCWSTGHPPYLLEHPPYLLEHPPYLLEHPPYLLEHRAPPVPAGAPTVPAGAPGTLRTCWSTLRTCWSTGHPPYLLEHPPYLLEHPPYLLEHRAPSVPAGAPSVPAGAPTVPAGAPTVPAGAPGTLRTCCSTLRTCWSTLRTCWSTLRTCCSTLRTCWSTLHTCWSTGYPPYLQAVQPSPHLH
uniref:cytosolic phospholipase A2 gamma-like n=1 Tax=Centroberyx gerrardi TaxID=166262 RepID=UPI003AAF5010